MKAILIEAHRFLNMDKSSVKDLVREIDINPDDLATVARYVDCDYVEPVYQFPDSTDWVLVDEEGLMNSWPLVQSSTPWLCGKLVGNIVIASSRNTDVEVTVEQVRKLILSGDFTFRKISSSDKAPLLEVTE